MDLTQYNNSQRELMHCMVHEGDSGDSTLRSWEIWLLV